MRLREIFGNLWGRKNCVIKRWTERRALSYRAAIRDEHGSAPVIAVTMRLTDPIRLPSVIKLLLSSLVLLVSAFCVLMLSLIPGFILHIILGAFFCPGYEAGETGNPLGCRWGPGWREMIGEFPYDFFCGFCLIFWSTAVELKYSRWVGLSVLILLNLLLVYLIGWNSNSLLRLGMVSLGGILGLFIQIFRDRKCIL